METINGTYTSAILHLAENPMTNIDPYARAQIQLLCNTEALAGSRIRIMPDVHPGKVGTIGFTATVGEKIMPLLLGIDLGCGMTIAHIQKGRKEWQRLDSVIRERIPAGSDIRNTPHTKAAEFDYDALECADHIQKERSALSLGTLGGGNHFIEIDSNGKDLYLVIHTGSRHFGKEITDFYMDQGQKTLRKNGIDLPYEMTWIDGTLKNNYLNDVRVANNYAILNRHIILEELLKGMKWKADDIRDCPHNYIDATTETLSSFGAPILRKGSISAKKDEPVIIPINMRDGVILGKGLGNPEWNCSAPHGAGRILKREDVKKSYTLSHFKSAMKGIYSNSISKETLDEAPFAYRNLSDIVDVIGESVTIEELLKPVYNFKAGN